MPNYKAIIQYDGTDHFGWQSQPNRNTIQDLITDAVFQITKHQINLIGSGRTDSGVHAIGQVANFKIDQNLDLEKFIYSLNSILPDSISVNSINEVEEDFHARFDANRRIYYYLIRKGKSPFYNRFSYFFPYFKQIDIHQLNILSKGLLGKKDFTSFCKSKSDTENKFCDVTNIMWHDSKELIFFRIESDRFLHGMVRTIVGTLLNSVVKKKDITYINEIIDAKDRKVAFESVPAKGLFLFKVGY